MNAICQSLAQSVARLHLLVCLSDPLENAGGKEGANAHLGFEKAHGMPAHLENNNQNQKNHLIVARVFRVIS
jgi:hypothetical protein